MADGAAVGEILERMQNQWNRPFRAGEAACAQRVRMLAAKLKPYGRDHLRAAFDRLVETHKGTWPEVPDWLRALKETRTPQQAGADGGGENPLAARRDEARRIFDDHYATTPLAAEAREGGWYTDYRLACDGLIRRALRERRDPFRLTLGSAWLDAARARAERFRLARDYQRSAAYLATHARPVRRWRRPASQNTPVHNGARETPDDPNPPEAQHETQQDGQQEASP